MVRLLVHVEGETEESFVKEMLRPHLLSVGFHQVSPRLFGNARQRDHRGGIRGWVDSKKDIIRHLKEDASAFSTTMVDYYGLPATGNRAWPGRLDATSLAFAYKAQKVESEMASAIAQEMGSGFNPIRFLPFVVMHEFEGLLFSDCGQFGTGIGRPDLIPSFQAIRDQFASPEEINDSPQTAPSKRVMQLCEGYQKPLLGTIAALEIGLDSIRKACPHFNDWLDQLEKLP